LIWVDLYYEAISTVNVQLYWVCNRVAMTKCCTTFANNCIDPGGLCVCQSLITINFIKPWYYEYWVGVPLGKLINCRRWRWSGPGYGFHVTFPLPSLSWSRRFYEIYYPFSYSNCLLFTTLGEVTDADNGMTSSTFWERSGVNRDPHQSVNPELNRGSLSFSFQRNNCRCRWYAVSERIAIAFRLHFSLHSVAIWKC